jgi:hypothetical protein
MLLIDLIGTRSSLNAAHAVDQGARIGRRGTGAPRRVSVGPHQHQAALIELSRRRIRDRHDGERHPPLSEGRLDRGGIEIAERIGIAEAQQRKAAAESGDARSPRGEPGVRRPAARMGGAALGSGQQIGEGS